MIYQTVKEGIRFTILENSNDIFVYAETKHGMAIGRGKSLEEALIQTKQFLMLNEGFIKSNCKLVAIWKLEGIRPYSFD